MEELLKKYGIDSKLSEDAKLSMLERERQKALRKLNHVFGDSDREKELEEELDWLDAAIDELEKAGRKHLSMDDVKIEMRSLSQTQVAFEEEKAPDETEELQIKELMEIRELQKIVMADSGKNVEISFRGIAKIKDFYESRGNYHRVETWLTYGAQWFKGVSYFSDELYALYRDGIGGLTDPEKKRYWTGRAAELGNRDACFEMGKYYLDPKSTLSNLNKAAMLFAKAADREHPQAYIYAFIAFYKMKDYKRAETCLIAGNRIGVPGTAYRLGVIYDVDENPEGNRNPQKALYWYEKAYEQEPDGDVCYGLGNLYADAGRYKEAVQILRRGVDEFHSDECVEALMELEQD